MPKHHYVPQFYLKRFGNGKYVSAILMDYNFQFVERASIRDQSCKPDYYESPDVERLNGLIEREASYLMQNIVRRVPLTADQSTFLKQYVVFQMMRTPTYIRDIENAMSVSISSLYAMSEGKEGFRAERPLIEVTDAKIWAWTHLQAAAYDTVLDLDVRYLVSKRNGFLTSDQPVTVYNPWALRGGSAGQGFGCRGLMLFLPIDNQVTIMLYDSEAYAIRAKDRRSARITIERDDEDRLNKLQMTGNRSVLYLPRPERHRAVQTLAREVRSTYPPASEIPVPLIARSEDGRSQVSSFARQAIDFGDWSFLYESEEWRKVPPNIRGFGIYGSRDTTPDAGQRVLLNARPWNSTRYTDDEGGVSYLRTSPRGLVR